MAQVVSVPELGAVSAADVRIGQLPDWLTITPMDGSGDMQLELTAEKNDSFEERSCDVLIVTETDPVLSVTIHVSQDAQTPYLWVTAVDQTEHGINFAAAGGSSSASILSNLGWSVAKLPAYVLTCAQSSFVKDTPYTVNVAYESADTQPDIQKPIRIECVGGTVSPESTDSFSLGSDVSSLMVTPTEDTCTVTIICEDHGDYVVGEFVMDDVGGGRDRR